ncbi:MAG: enoyl-CoA hydratase/isomerase family protein [Acidimicrobiales bacterium]|nr:enoyl-CoA hydratase/isomerase family protein [Acidimicrobiales bacterium]
MSVRYEVDHRIAIITLDRPEARNALDPAMLYGLAEAWDAAEDDDDVLAVILTGAGDEAFCSGADLKLTIPGVTGGRGDEQRYPNTNRTLLRDRFFPKPIVAAVNGHCVAGGLELLLATDLRYAAEHATFGLQQVRWGLMPISGATVRLPRQVPHCRAMELLLLGDRIDAPTALEIGLVNEVVPAGPGQALDRAREIAERLCRNGPLAVRRIKEAVWRGQRLPQADALLEELRLGTEVYASDDAKEGPAAFADKREPRFTGR